MTDAASISEPISLKALLDGAFRQTRKHFKATMLSFGAPLAVIWAVIPVVQVALLPAGAPTRPNPIPQLALTIGIGVFSLVVFSLAWSAISVFANRTLAGRQVSGSEAWLAALEPKLLGTSLLVGTSILLGMVCCILPGIYVALILTAALPVMVHEGCYGFRALARSSALMTHNPRHDFTADPRVRSFLLSLSAGLISYAVSFIVQLPLMAVMMVLMFRSISSGHQLDPNAFERQILWLQIPSNALGMLLQTVVLEYTAFGVSELYFDILRRKEGTDLVAAAERMAGTEPLG